VVAHRGANVDLAAMPGMDVVDIVEAKTGGSRLRNNGVVEVVLNVAHHRITCQRCK
jgi:hypothetical protein